MSDNTSKTLSELYAELQHKQIAERAEDRFRGDQVKRRRLSERIAHYMPHAIVIVWLAAYALSAPHTAELFNRITPDVVWFDFNIKWFAVNVAPLAVEGFVFVLSAMRQYGRKKLTGLLVGLLGLSVLVNVVGGIVILQSEGITMDSLMKLQFDINGAWILTSVFAGVLISLVSYVAGTLIVEFSTGVISMEIDSSKSWFGRTKYYALREAFYNAALKHGATPTRASKYAETMAAQYCDGEVAVYEDGTVQAIAQPQVMQADTMPQVAPAMYIGTESGTVRTVRKSSNDFGFAGMARGNAQVLGVQDTSPTMDSVQSPMLSRMTTKNVIDWVQENPEGWQQYAIGSTKRDKSRAIAQALTGDASGYKTIERAFDRMAIEL